MNFDDVSQNKKSKVKFSFAHGVVFIGGTLYNALHVYRTVLAVETLTVLSVLDPSADFFTLWPANNKMVAAFRLSRKTAVKNVCG